MSELSDYLIPVTFAGLPVSAWQDSEINYTITAKKYSCTPVIFTLPQLERSFLGVLTATQRTIRKLKISLTR